MHASRVAIAFGIFFFFLTLLKNSMLKKQHTRVRVREERKNRFKQKKNTHTQYNVLTVNVESHLTI